MALLHRTIAVELLAELRGRVVLADLAVYGEGDPFRLHQVDAALDDALVELHVGDAVHQKAADAVVALEHRDPVASPVEPVSGSQTGGAGADDGDLLAGTDWWRLGDLIQPSSKP